MATWFLSKIKFQREDEAGSLKTFTESYLLDAVSHSEAESRAYKQIVSGAQEFTVQSITRYRLADIFFYEDGDIWFRSKVSWILVNERTGKEKRVFNNMLVNSDNIHQALERIFESLKSMLIPYEISEVAQTQILDVIPYSAEEEEIPSNLRPLSEVMKENSQAKELSDIQAEAILHAGKTFFETPNTPYKSGDIWLVGGNRAICRQSREEGEFHDTDWEKLI